MFKNRVLTRSALLALPVALVVAGCQTAPSDTGAVQSDGALETAQSAKQDALRNQASVTAMREQMAALRDEILKLQENNAAERAAEAGERAAEAGERAAAAAERAAEAAQAAADKADRIFQRKLRK